MGYAEILDQALKLKPQERFQVIDSLLQSLDAPDPAIESAWADEAQHRLIAWREGKLQGIAAEDIFGQA